MAEARGPGMVTRLYVTDGLHAGGAVELGEPRAHYLRNVLRCAAGDAVGLFNGQDGEWRARIETLTKSRCALAVLDQVRPQAAEADLWLVFAPIKRARIDFVAEKATELGAAALWPVFTQHTAMARVNVERLRANAVEAAEQTERLSVPEVFAPASLGEALARWPAERRLLLCAEAGAAQPIAAALGRFAGGSAAPGPWAVLIGPEGGFARAELDLLVKLPFVTPVGLGPRVLRADTAAVVALGCWQAILGDGRDRPPVRVFA